MEHGRRARGDPGTAAVGRGLGSPGTGHRARRPGRGRRRRHRARCAGPEIRPGELVLAVGVAAGSAQAVDVVRRAGAAGACGVVFGPERPEGTLGALRSAAHEAGTAVLFRTWYRWEELVAVLRAGLAAAGCRRYRPPGAWPWAIWTGWPTRWPPWSAAR
ncbi:hypothetical protein ACFQ3Z_11585 [Streptomyces nogalater]